MPSESLDRSLAGGSAGLQRRQDEPDDRQLVTVGRLAQWWLDQSVLVKGLCALALPLLVLCGMATAGLIVQNKERSERADSIAASTLASSARMVLADALDAETGMRAYVGTADAAFLAPYAAATARLPADLAGLQTAARDEQESDRAESVAQTVAEEVRLLDALRASVLSGATGPEMIEPMIAGKVVMDRLRAQVTETADVPARLVVQKRAAISALESKMRFVQVGGLLLGVLGAVAGVALFTSGISRRVESAARNADRLGQGEPLGLTTPAADELGQLARSMTRARQLLDARQRELVSARDQAIEATHVKNTFLSRTSHELRTPLNAILGFAQLLGLSDLDAPDRESTNRILDAGRHLLALINDLIDTALIEAGELRLSVEPVAVATVTRQVADLVGPLALARGITVDHRCHNLALAALADAQRLRQVLVNLGSNAVKYNRLGGSIVIDSCAVGDEFVDVTVSDTGPGLSDEEIQRIFVPFERLEAEQHGIEGSGIGLPLSLALSRAMDGDVTVLSTPGLGSTFTVRLRRAPDIEPTPTDPVVVRAAGQVEPVPAADAATLVVLSIEDNPANSQMLARLFSRIPDTQLHAEVTGSAGLAAACRLRPDLILLDLHLPDVSGEEVFAQLQAEMATAHIPVIVLSADATPGTIRRLLARGAAGYLTKPLNLTELVETINTAVPRPQAEIPAVSALVRRKQLS